MPDHLICLLRGLNAGQETIVITRHGTMNWFKIGKGVQKGCVLSSSLFNLYAENQAKCWAGWITGWNQDCWKNYQQPQDITLMAERKEKLKSLLIKVKEESGKAGWKLNRKRSLEKEDHGIWSHHFMWYRWGKKWKQWETIFLGSKITAAINLKDNYSLEGNLWQT